jgi:hypothetical protein
MNATLEFVSGRNGRALRTPAITGAVVEPLIIGRQFIMRGAPLDPTKDYRHVETSVVRSIEVEAPGVYRFETENSVYRLTARA